MPDAGTRTRTHAQAGDAVVHASSTVAAKVVAALASIVASVSMAVHVVVVAPLAGCTHATPLPPMPPVYDASWPSAMLCQPSTAGLAPQGKMATIRPLPGLSTL